MEAITVDATRHNELLSRELMLVSRKCAMLHYATCDNWPLCSCRRSTGMYYEGAGGEVQAAGSTGGSHAEGAEVPPTTEGTRHLTTAVQSF